MFWRAPKGAAGYLTANISARLRTSPGNRVAKDLEPRPLRFDHTNASIALGDQLILKLFRRLENGESPDLEIGRFLTDRISFTHSPPLLGSIDYRTADERPHTLAVLHGYVANQGDAWEFSRGELSRYFERAAACGAFLPEPTPALSQLIGIDAPGDNVTRMMGAYLDAARLMGRRTAELHLALASRPDDPKFAPEACSPGWQRATYQSMRNVAGQSLRTLSVRRRTLDTANAERAGRICTSEIASRLVSTHS